VSIFQVLGQYIKVIGSALLSMQVVRTNVIVKSLLTYTLLFIEFVSLFKEASTRNGYTPPEFIVAYKEQVELAVAPLLSFQIAAFLRLLL
jgi:hypothetical protein